MCRYREFVSVEREIAGVCVESLKVLVQKER